mgnify:CR=1 FL=1
MPRLKRIYSNITTDRKYRFVDFRRLVKKSKGKGRFAIMARPYRRKK